VSKKERWKAEPEPQDFSAADDYLVLILGSSERAEVVRQLKAAKLIYWQPKDLLRSSRLALLPEDDADVTKELKKVKKGVLLSPVLLARGDAALGVPMTIADGYHRICASYYLDEDGDIPCLIADAPRLPGDSAASLIVDPSSVPLPSSEAS
jgi:hypothetical protein